MKVVIESTPEEIAALSSKLQERTMIDREKLGKIILTLNNQQIARLTDDKPFFPHTL